MNGTRKYFSTDVQIRELADRPGFYRVRFNPSDGGEGLELFVDKRSLDALGAMLNIVKSAKD